VVDDGRVGRCGSTGSRAAHEHHQRDRGCGADRAHASKDPHSGAAARARTQLVSELRAKRLPNQLVVVPWLRQLSQIALEELQI
jgi:hypothetical protein